MFYFSDPHLFTSECKSEKKKTNVYLEIVSIFNGPKWGNQGKLYNLCVDLRFNFKHDWARNLAVLSLNCG